MWNRKLVPFLAVAFFATACSDENPTAVQNEPLSESAQFNHNPGHRTGALSNIPITGTLSDGGTFSGVLNITSLAFQGGQLLATGSLVGTATDALGTVTQITQTFANLPIDLLQTGGSCRILLLEIPGGLQLDLLGLVVDLAPVELEIRAERGPGNLLGNLLCALVGLLDQGGPLSGILGLLNQINGLL